MNDVSTSVTPKSRFSTACLLQPHAKKKYPPLKEGNAINQKRSLTKSTFHRIWQDLIDENASRRLRSGVKNHQRLDFSFFGDLYVSKVVYFSTLCGLARFPTGSCLPTAKLWSILLEKCLMQVASPWFSIWRKNKNKKTLLRHRPLTLARSFNWANVKPVSLLAEF